MTLHRIILPLALIGSWSLFGADIQQKVPYYIVKLHNTGLFSSKEIYVPKSCFDAAVNDYYLLKYQHQVFGYEKKITGYDIVGVMFHLMPDKDYQPGDNKKKFTVDCRVYGPSTMNIDKTKFKTKHQVLKFIEDKSQQELEKQLEQTKEFEKQLGAKDVIKY